MALDDRSADNPCSLPLNWHGDGSLSPTQTKRDNRAGLLHSANIGTISQPQEEVVDTIEGLGFVIW